jgi:hypothetical protein
MAEWDLFIDESGNFYETDAEYQTIAGMLIPRVDALDLAALREDLEDLVPWWSWPFHATEFRRPGAHIVRWWVSDARQVPSGLASFGAGLEECARLLEGKHLPESIQALLVSIQRSFRNAASPLRDELPERLILWVEETCTLLVPSWYQFVVSGTEELRRLVFQLLGADASARGAQLVVTGRESETLTGWTLLPPVPFVVPQGPWLNHAWSALWQSAILARTRDNEQHHDLRFRPLNYTGVDAFPALIEFLESLSALYGIGTGNIPKRANNIPVADFANARVDGTAFQHFDRNATGFHVYADWLANLLAGSLRAAANSRSAEVLGIANAWYIPTPQSELHLVHVGPGVASRWSHRRDKRKPSLDTPMTLPAMVKWATAAATATDIALKQGGLL